MRIGVISDTHVPVRARVLPGAVFEVLAGVDLILHAGDLVTLDVLDELAAIAPVMAVHGNVDRPEVIERLPAALRVEVGADGSVKVNTQPGSGGRWLAAGSLSPVHGEGESFGDLERKVPGEANLLAGAPNSGTAASQPNGKPLIIGLVHGHDGAGRTTPERAASHFPDAGVVVFGHSHQPMNEWRDGRLFFNPGSATDPRRAPWPSVGVIEVGRAVRAVRAEIIRLAG